MERRMRAGVGLSLLALGCTVPPADPAHADAGAARSSSTSVLIPSSRTGSGSGSGAATSVAATSASSGARSGELTLENCPTQLAADVPAFYRTYFRCVTASRSGSNVVLETRALPPHRSNYYPSTSPNHEPFDTSRGPNYRANPNQLAQQTVRLTIPDQPVSRGLTITTAMVDRQANTNPNEYPLGPAGIALDSVLMFNATAAPGDNIDNEQYTFDRYAGHPQMTGEYHYHSPSPGPLEVLNRAGLSNSTVPGFASVEVYGIMCDGTLVLGCAELDGARVSAAGLDGQNGHVHSLTDGAGTTHFTDRYHVHMCPQEFPSHRYAPEIRFYSTCTVGR